jgi:hypothetical protein
MFYTWLTTLVHINWLSAECCAKRVSLVTCPTCIPHLFFGKSSHLDLEKENKQVKSPKAKWKTISWFTVLSASKSELEMGQRWMCEDFKKVLDNCLMYWQGSFCSTKFLTGRLMLQRLSPANPCGWGWEGK